MTDEILGSIFSTTFIGAILRVSTPILFPSLGALVSQKAGVINIGLEGIMLLAAFFGALVSAATQSALLGVGAGLLAGALAALLLAFFHLQFKGDLILGGIAINILGSAVTIALLYALTGDRTKTPNLTPIAVPTVDLSFLRGVPILGDPLYAIIGSQNLMTWLSLIMVGVVAFLLFRTPFGKHLRAVGENADAAASVGIHVRRVRYMALVLSGLLAAMGGIHLSMGYLTGFTRDMTAGRGYIALVSPALGGETPLGTMVAALIFGTFDALSVRLGNAAIPSQFPRMIPYAATIIALVIYSIVRQRRIVARQRKIEAQARG